MSEPSSNNSVTLTANLSGDPNGPNGVTIDLVYTSGNSNFFHHDTQNLDFTSLGGIHPPPAVDIYFQIGTATFPQPASVTWDSSVANDINIKTSPGRGAPPPGLFSPVRQSDTSLWVHDMNNASAKVFAYCLSYDIGPPYSMSVSHDPEIQNTGQSTDG